jgi:hypothetical protein
MATRGSVPWYFLPFLWIWRLAGVILGRLGKRNALIVGAVLLVGGTLNCVSVVGLLIGLPMLALGVAVVIRALLPPKR